MSQHDPIWDDPQQLKKKRIIGIISVSAVFLLIVLATILLRKPLISAIRDKSSFKAWMDSTGFLKYPLMVGIMALQVIIALIPGEPVEIVAGYIFGTWGGLLLCLLGTALGSVIIILTVRKLGMKFVTLFVEREQIENLKILQNPKKRDAALFMLFLIPGTPKDILTYLSGLVPMHLGKYLLITSIARIPSIISSTMGGSMLGRQEYKIAIIMFAITLALTLLAKLVYKLYQARKKPDAEEAEKTAQPEETPEPELAVSPAPEALEPGLPEEIQTESAPEIAAGANEPEEEASDVPAQ